MMIIHWHFRYKKTLMAKKAAALQSFQKCEVQNLSIPATILEDVEIKEEGDFDSRTMDGKEANGGNGDSEEGKLRVNISSDLQKRSVNVEGIGYESHSREPSDRIELAGSPLP